MPCPVYGIKCIYGAACRHILPVLKDSKPLTRVAFADEINPFNGLVHRGLSESAGHTPRSVSYHVANNGGAVLKQSKRANEKRAKQQLSEEVRKIVKPEAMVVNTKKEDKMVAWKTLMKRSADYQVRHKIFLQKKQKRDTFRQALSTAQAALKKDEKDVKSPVKLNWADEPLDNDDEIDREGQLLAAELKEMRAAAREMWGTKVFKISLFEAVLVGSNGSGVANTTLAIDPSTLTEFSSVAALFDEYRDVAYEYSFGVMAAVVNSTVGLNALGAVAYDPTDGSTVASLPTLCQLQQHQLIKKNVYNGGGAIINSNNQMHTFKIQVPEGVLSAVNNPVSVGTSNWQPTGISGGSNIQPYGWLKTFFDNVGASSSVLGGIGKHHCEFRMRS